MAAELTDVMPALISYQEELSAGRLQPPPSRAHTDPELRLFTDVEGGEMRITYTRVDGHGTVTAYVSLLRVESIDGLPCIAVGYAVPERFRGQGRASEILAAVVEEVKHGFRDAGQAGLAIEAVVGADNAASIAVASKVLSDSPRDVTDSISGKPALQFVLKVRF